MSENTNTENKTNENGAAEVAAPEKVAGNGEANQVPPTETAATSATVKIEGQEIPLEEIGRAHV